MPNCNVLLTIQDVKLYQYRIQSYAHKEQQLHLLSIIMWFVIEITVIYYEFNEFNR